MDARLTAHSPGRSDGEAGARPRALAAGLPPPPRADGRRARDVARERPVLHPLSEPAGSGRALPQTPRPGLGRGAWPRVAGGQPASGRGRDGGVRSRRGNRGGAALEAEGLTLRTVRPADRDRVLEITKDVWNGGDYLPEVFDSWAADPGASFQAAELDGVVVAVPRLRPARPGAWYS